MRATCISGIQTSLTWLWWFGLGLVSNSSNDCAAKLLITLKVVKSETKIIITLFLCTIQSKFLIPSVVATPLQGILYRTGKDHYRWSRRKSRLFLKTKKKFLCFVNKLDFHGTNGNPSLPIRVQYSLSRSSLTGVPDSETYRYSVAQPNHHRYNTFSFQLEGARGSATKRLRYDQSSSSSSSSSSSHHRQVFIFH